MAENDRRISCPPLLLFPSASMLQIYTLNSKFVEQEVKAFNALRLELQKMGLGGQLGGWKQLTSGGHAVFLFSQVLPAS